MTADQQSAALDGLRVRVQSIVAETDTGRDDDELLAAFLELRNPEDLPAVKSEMRARIAALPAVVAERLPDAVASRLPGGTLLHRAIARATRRRDEALLEEIRGLARQIKDRLLELTDAACPSLMDSAEQATSQIQAVVDAVATIEDGLATMLSRIEALEARLGPPERSS